MVADFQLPSGVCLSKERGRHCFAERHLGCVKFSWQEKASDVNALKGFLVGYRFFRL